MPDVRAYPTADEFEPYYHHLNTDDRYLDPAAYEWLQYEIVLHESGQAAALGNFLAETFGGDAASGVIDVGCGPGIYLTPFKERGLRVYGVDGSPGGGMALEHDEFEVWDLRNEWHPPFRAGIALCIEVAEHLRPEHAETLVETMTRCADFIFWTAARPGQGGEGHYNEQSKEWWVKLFNQYGYDLNKGHTSAVHRVVDKDRAYEHCHWIRWNSIVLTKQVG